MRSYKFPPTGWIWTDLEETVAHRRVLFRKALTIDTVPEKAMVKLSADSRYRLYVNGVSVSFGPCKGDNQVWYYEEIDLAPYLKPGENILAVVVLRISPLPKKGNPMGNHSIWRTFYPGFYLKGEICINGQVSPFVADETWKWKEDTYTAFIPEDKYHIYLDIFEKATGNPALQGWLTPGYNMDSWHDAIPRPLPHLPRGISPTNLLPRPIPPMYEHFGSFSHVQEVRQSSISESAWDGLLIGKAVTLEANSEHIVEIDAGVLTTGFLSFEFAGGTGAKVEIMTAESYVFPSEDDSPLAMPKKGNRTDSKKGHLQGFTDYYTVGGFGTKGSPESYEPFWFRTFRFIQLKIKTADEPLEIQDFSYRETAYPLEAKTKVETSDTTLAPIWDISLRSLQMCMHETYEDCPFYEQLQYAMDTRTQILYTYTVSADDRMARRAIDDFHRSLRSDGLTNCCYPTMSPNVIPGFSLYYIMMIHDHMMYFGDKALVARYLPTVDAILNFFERHLDTRGLVDKIGGVLYANPRWSFIDWTTQWGQTAGVPDAIKEGPITMESLLYAYTLGIGAELSEYTGKKEQANDYTRRAIKIKTAINQYCRNKEGIYQDGPGVEKYSQHCQVWAVLSETAPMQSWQPLMEKALTEKDWPKCSVAMAFYLFRALEMANMYNKTKELWAPWQEMLKNNLTTCQENDTDARSDCHAWGSLALYELPATILGVRPAKPGYKAIAVNPIPGYLDWAKGTVHTPKGEIYVEWSREAGNIKVKVKAPEGVEVVRASSSKE